MAAASSVMMIESQTSLFPRCGIRLSYLTQGNFWKDCQISKSDVEEWTTQTVCEEIIIPRTRNYQSSYCDYLLKKQSCEYYDKDKKEDRSLSYVGSAANVFVSHAHCNNFLQLIETLEHHFALGSDLNGENEGTTCAEEENNGSHHPHDDIILWLDLFSMNQHSPLDWNFEWLSSTFRAAIQDIGRTVMVMSPWKAPVPFQRAWCIYEAYCTIQTNAEIDLEAETASVGSRVEDDDSLSSPLEIAMSPRDRHLFVQDILKKRDPYTTMNDIWTTIRSKHSVCSKASDQERIFEAIKKGGGFQTIDTVVLARYRKWVLQVALQALREHEGSDSRNDDVRVDSAAMLRWIIGTLFKMQGKYGPAEEFLETSMNIYQARSGLDNVRTLEVMNTLGRLYELQNRKEDAERAYQDCLQRRLKLLGPTHPQTLDSVNNLALLYGSGYGGRLADAKALCKLCLKQRRASSMLGEDHPDTIASASNLASLYYRQAQQSDADAGEQEHLVAKAENLFRYCLAKRVELLGEDHPDTIHSMNDLASLCLVKGDGHEAAKLYHECYYQRKTTLGEDHRETLQSLHNLALVYSSAIDYDIDRSLLCPLNEQSGRENPTSPEELFRECLQKQTALLGPSHTDTLDTTCNLALLLEREERYHEASAFLEDCLEQRIASVGEDHPDTLSVMRQLTTLDEKIKFQRGRPSQFLDTNPIMDPSKPVPLSVNTTQFDVSDESDNESVTSIVSRASHRSERSAGYHSIGSRTITSRASRLSNNSREGSTRRAKSSLSLDSTGERTNDLSQEESFDDADSTAKSTARTVETTKESTAPKRDSLSSQTSRRSDNSTAPFSNRRQPRRRVSITLPLQPLCPGVSKNSVISASIKKVPGRSRSARGSSGVSSQAERKLPLRRPSFTPGVRGSSSSETSRSVDSLASDIIFVSKEEIEDSYGVRGIYTGTMSRSTTIPNGHGQMDYIDETNSTKGRSYAGEWMQGSWNGLGRLSHGGDFYRGYFKNDHKHGPGTMHFKNGQIFEGYYKRDLMVRGKVTYPDGSKFEGRFRHDKHEGNGKFLFADGALYRGEFAGGKFHGQGSLFWTDGTWYQGAFEAGQRHGKGKEFNADGSVRHEGHFHRGQPLS